MALKPSPTKINTILSITYYAMALTSISTPSPDISKPSTSKSQQIQSDVHSQGFLLLVQKAQLLYKILLSSISCRNQMLQRITNRFHSWTQLKLLIFLDHNK